MPLELFKLDADEAYRFTYGRCFSLYGLSLTITKLKKAYNLEVYIIKDINYLTGGVPHFETDTTYNIVLTESNWNDITKELNYVDFWGMKYDNQRVGLDGSTLSIYGIDRNYGRNVRLNEVSRWSPERMAIFKPYLSTLKLAKLDKQLYLHFSGTTASAIN